VILKYNKTQPLVLKDEDMRKTLTLIALYICVAYLIAGCTAQPSAEQPRSPIVIQDIEPAQEPDEMSLGETTPPAAPDLEPEPYPYVSPEPFIPTTPAEIESLLSDTFSYNGLIDMEDLNSGFFFSIAYATEDNFTGQQLYDRPLCLAHTDLAKALLHAQAKADEYGHRLLIYDIYRPTDVQRRLRELTPPNLRQFVAQPGPRANHTKGVAVDLTLADLDGVPLPMPSGFDEFTVRASATYSGGTEEERSNRDLLISIMSDSGFRVASGEWWHFALTDASRYPVLDVTFDGFERARNMCPTRSPGG
jgi:D-alanyl-D-alanine dipeptidase